MKLSLRIFLIAMLVCCMPVLSFATTHQELLAVGELVTCFKNDPEATSCILSGTSALVVDERVDTAVRLEHKCDLSEGIYLIVGSRMESAIGAAESEWTSGGSQALGLGVTMDALTEKRLDLAKQESMEARVRFHSCGEDKWKIENVSTGKYYRAVDRLQLVLTELPKDATVFTITEEIDSEYGNCFRICCENDLCISDWGAKKASLGMTIAAKDKGGCLWLYRVMDYAVTIRGNAIGTSHLTIGKDTWELKVTTPCAANGERVYASVEAAVNDSDSNAIITILDPSSPEDILVPTGITVIFGDEEFGVPEWHMTNDCGGFVRTDIVDGVPWLFLPSDADLSILQLDHIPHDAVVQGLSDHSEPGIVYPITIVWQLSDVMTLKKMVNITKSDHLGALYISDLDVTIDYLNTNKNNFATTGDILKVSADGTPEANSVLKKMKGHGNTTFSLGSGRNPTTKKKPYTLKLQDKAELIPGAGAAKNWILIANNFVDYTGIRNYGALTLYQMIDGSMPIQVEPILLYVEGSFRGMYLLTERVEIGKNRVNIDKTIFDTEDKSESARVLCDNYSDFFDAENGPDKWSYAEKSNHILRAGVRDTSKDPAINSGVLAYSYAEQSVEQNMGGILLELSWQYVDNPCWFVTGHGAMVAVREPEYASMEQVQQAAIFVQEFEDALFSPSGFNSKGKHYSEYADLASIAKTYLLSCFTQQLDFMDCSEFFYIDAQQGTLTGKLKGGPAWDYDYLSMRNTGLFNRKGSIGQNGHMIWIEQLLSRGDFAAELYRLQRVEMAAAVDELLDVVLPAYKELVWTSVLQDQRMWLWNAELQGWLNGEHDHYLTRRENWTKIWSDDRNALRGVTASVQGGKLVAEDHGASSYQWYKIDETIWLGDAVPGADSAQWVPEEAGIYYVEVTGEPLEGTLVSTMISNPVTITESDDPLRENTQF